MDRFAIFVDAGYLFAEGAKLCFGEDNRSYIRCNYNLLFDRLVEISSKNCNLSLLRIYWYDAAKDGVPDDNQKDIAEMSNVKIRIGRMTGSGQKGVDSLIYRDITTLAQNRSIATGYLLAGDEDLRIGISTAQDMGVRIVLLGISHPDPCQSNQSKPLIREADELIILEKCLLEKYIYREDYQPSNQQRNEIPREKYNEFVQFGYDCASNLGRLVDIDDNGRIPREIDRDLIKEAEKIYGNLRDSDYKNNITKRALRDGFRKYMQEKQNL